MRSPTDASLAPWPMRILRPWLLASAAGLSIGLLLLRFDSTTAELESADYSLRAAGYSSTASLVTDPFAPAASLAAPPDAPPGPVVALVASSPATAPESASSAVGPAPDAP